MKEIVEGVIWYTYEMQKRRNKFLKEKWNILSILERSALEGKRTTAPNKTSERVNIELKV